MKRKMQTLAAFYLGPTPVSANANFSWRNQLITPLKPERNAGIHDRPVHSLVRQEIEKTGKNLGEMKPFVFNYLQYILDKYVFVT